MKWGSLRFCKDSSDEKGNDENRIGKVWKKKKEKLEQKRNESVLMDKKEGRKGSKTKKINRINESKKANEANEINEAKETNKINEAKKVRECRKRCCFFGIIVGILTVFLFFFWFLGNKEESSYQDDYYEAVNEGVLSSLQVQDGEYTWSTFSEAQEQADNEMVEVFQEILSEEDRELIDRDFEKKLHVVYENACDIEYRNQEGLGILSDYIEQVFEVTTVDELISVISLIEKELGLSILSNIVVDSDYEDTRLNMVYFYPVVFAFGTSSDYYVNADYMTYKAYIKRGMVQLLEIYGYSKEEAREISRELISFYEDIGRVSKSNLELSDISGYFQKVSILELKNVYSSFSIETYLKDQGIDREVDYSFVDRVQYEKINSYLNDSYLELWKKHLLIMILSNYAGYLSEEYEQVVISLNQAITGGDEEKTREESSRELVISLFSEELDVFYENRVVSEEKREYLYKMFADFKEVYAEMLKENEWLSEETIGLAIEKLNAMEIYVGMDSYDQDFSSVEKMQLEGNSLLSNIIEVRRVRREEELERLKDGSEVRAIGESVVNAYYSPMKNAVYIPSAFVFLLDLNASYYENIGSVGMVIAHEITHGFDWNGSQFDKDGNFQNWWLDQDRKRFSELKEEVIDYYNRYEVLPGRFVNGELTVNENIADLGALRCISLLAEKEGAEDLEKKEMYSSFARFWVSQSREEYIKLLLLQDTHAPNKYRVNAVLASLDDFYELYGVSFWNEMYVKKSERVQVW